MVSLPSLEIEWTQLASRTLVAANQQASLTVTSNAVAGEGRERIVSKLNWDRESRRDKVRERGGDPVDLPREHSSTNRCRHDWSGYFRAALLDPRWQRRCTKCGQFSAPRIDLPAGAKVTDSQKRPAKKAPSQKTATKKAQSTKPAATKAKSKRPTTLPDNPPRWVDPNGWAAIDEIQKRERRVNPRKKK